MKKSVVFLLLVLMIPLVLAQNKLDIKTTKDAFKPGENITIIASLYDSNNNPLDTGLNLKIESPNKKVIENTIDSNKIAEISLLNYTDFGYWKATATYQDLQANTIFFIEENELASMSLDNNILTIRNMGNTRYTKTIQIVIGDTIGSKDVDLQVGEETSFRLLAPDGTYNIRINDGTTTLTKSDVQLTGDIIGILDAKMANSNTPITGINPEKSTGITKQRSSIMIYTIILILIGAAILLSIERYYKKRSVHKNSQ